MRDGGIGFERTLDGVRDRRLRGQCRIAELEVDRDVVTRDADAADSAGRDEIGAGMRIGDAGEEAPDVRVEGFAHQREVKRKDLALCQRRRCGAP